MYTRIDIARCIAEKQGITLTEAKAMADTVISTISDTLRSGIPVKIIGFGKFVIIDRKAKVGFNIHTGERIDIPACKVVKFLPYDDLKNL